jgi:hypothetical protein
MTVLRNKLVQMLQRMAHGPRAYQPNNSEAAVLLKMGLIQETGGAAQKNPYTGQLRREYEITDAGRAVLAEQLANEVARQR